MTKKTGLFFSILIFSCFIISTAFGAGGGGVVTADPTKHFDPKGKMPSEFTIELQNGLRKSLPFEDKRDFEEAKKGFIAAPPYKHLTVGIPTTVCLSSSKTRHWTRASRRNLLAA